MSTAWSTGCSGLMSRLRRSAGRPISRCSASCPTSSACRGARSGSWRAPPGGRSWSWSTDWSRRSSLPGIRACGYDRDAEPGVLSDAAISRAIGSVVRARGSHPRGHWFESSIAHQNHFTDAGPSGPVSVFGSRLHRGGWSSQARRSSAASNGWSRSTASTDRMNHTPNGIPRATVRADRRPAPPASDTGLADDLVSPTEQMSLERLVFAARSRDGRSRPRTSHRC
jgi:hypothetical protein